jgi:hypothetical protein
VASVTTATESQSSPFEESPQHTSTSLIECSSNVMSRVSADMEENTWCGSDLLCCSGENAFALQNCQNANLVNNLALCSATCTKNHQTVLIFTPESSEESVSTSREQAGSALTANPQPTKRTTREQRAKNVQYVHLLLSYLWTVQYESRADCTGELIMSTQ